MIHYFTFYSLSQPKLPENHTLHTSTYPAIDYVWERTRPLTPLGSHVFLTALLLRKLNEESKKLLDRAIFSWRPKVIRNCFIFLIAALCLVQSSSPLERFSIEYRKIKTKPITYQLDYSAKTGRSKTKTTTKVITWSLLTPHWKSLCSKGFQLSVEQYNNATRLA